MPYERIPEGEDLSFPEILVTLLGCRPARIGPIFVRGFLLGQFVHVCRREPYEDFHFETDAKQNAYKLEREAAFKAVADLIKKGWAEIIPHERLVWAENQPRVKSLINTEMLRLTKEGEKIVKDSKIRNPVLSPRRPA
jgi:hypothetical protein